jgi:hypothetical protein
VTESDQTEYDQTSHYGIMESDKALFGTWSINCRNLESSQTSYSSNLECGKSIVGIWNQVKHHIPQIWNVINQKPHFDKAECGKTEPDQKTTKMGIISGATFR